MYVLAVVFVSIIQAHLLKEYANKHSLIVQKRNALYCFKISKKLL
jgi:hypothetical protein